MASDVDQLLNAEQAVQELLGELRILKSEIGEYGSAKKSLEETRKTLAKFIFKTDSLAGKSHDIILTLQKLGTPEILSRIERESAALKKENAGLRTLVVVGIVLSAPSSIATLIQLIR